MEEYVISTVVFTSPLAGECKGEHSTTFWKREKTYNKKHVSNITLGCANTIEYGLKWRVGIKT